MATSPLFAAMKNLRFNKESIGTAASMFGRVGTRGLVIVARGYLGPLAERAGGGEQPSVILHDEAGNVVPETRVAGLSSREVAILGLATTKLVYEVGELALHNPTLESGGKLPVFTLDERGNSPAMSLAHILAAVRWWRSSTEDNAEPRYQTKMASVSSSETAIVAQPRAKLYQARTEYYAGRTVDHTLAPSTSRGPTMSSQRCGSCGGSHTAPPAPQVPTYDPCNGGLVHVPRSPEKSCGCSGACSCKSASKERTYDSEKCPTFAISCETKQALRDCAKEAVCELLKCMAEMLCPDGRFDSKNIFANKELGTELINCVGQAACRFMHCVPDALCEPDCALPPAPADCIPCGYAVEVVK